VSDGRYPLALCQRRLARLWYLGALPPTAILLVQTANGVYPDASAAWKWLLPTIAPTLGLVTTVLGAGALRARQGGPAATCDRFFFRVTFWLSAAYLLTVLFTLGVQPFSAASPADFLKSSHAVLGPFQGIVATSMGVFFAKSRREASSPAAAITPDRR